ARALLTTDHAPDLSTVERRLTLRADDGWICAHGGTLVAKAATEAPGIRLWFTAEGDNDVQPLRDGTVDLDIGVIDDPTQEIRVEPLTQESWVPLVAADHPLTRGPVTWQRLVSHPYVAVSRPHGRFDELLASHGLRRRVVAVTPTATAAAHLLFASDVVCLFMHTFATHAMERLGLRALRTPDPMPVVQVSQAWHPRSENDPAHRWLRQTVKDLGHD
ncbi:LysR substrate-binding domain-containing protein, partial [Kibdelosporangium lantanae]